MMDEALMSSRNLSDDSRKPQTVLGIVQFLDKSASPSMIKHATSHYEWSLNPSQTGVHCGDQTIYAIAKQL